MKIIKLLILLAAAYLGAIYYQRYYAVANLTKKQDAPASISHGQAPPSRWNSNNGGIGKVGGLGKVGGVEPSRQNNAPHY